MLINAVYKVDSPIVIKCEHCPRNRNVHVPNNLFSKRKYCFISTIVKVTSMHTKQSLVRHPVFLEFAFQTCQNTFLLYVLV